MKRILKQFLNVKCVKINMLKSVTPDRGKEFAFHAEVTEKLVQEKYY